MDDVRLTKIRLEHSTVEDCDNRDLFTTDVRLHDETLLEVSTEFALFLVRNALENAEESNLSRSTEIALQNLEKYFELARKGEL